MRFESIGIRAASRSRRAEEHAGRGSGGFTLIEALVALALVLAFAAALTPHLFQSRRIVADADSRVAAHVLLRTLLDAPFDRTGMAQATREGALDGLRWRRLPPPARSVKRIGQPGVVCLSGGRKRGLGTQPDDQRRDGTARASKVITMRASHANTARDGFTLVEVLAAFAIGAVIIAACAAL